MRPVTREKRKFKGELFDLYKVYKTREEANKKAKELRKKKTLFVRVVRDYYWTKNTKYYLYTSPISRSISSVNYFDNLFDKHDRW
tara:strand:+ start:152 stop:406 length:255 start_codon:yes stop_codon:yes gene_type:complete